MKNFDTKNLQINFNQAEDALTIPVESRHDYKCGSATQSGRSMIEMLGVLAIIGVLSVGGIAGYSKAIHRYRINKTIEQISMLTANIKTFFATQKSYDGLDSYTDDGKILIKKAKLVPDEMIEYDTDGITIKQFSTPLSENIHIFQSFQNEKAFLIQFNTFISEEACIDFMSQDWSNLTSGLIGISMDSTELDSNIGCGGSNGYVWCLGDPAPIPLETVIKYCENSDDRHLYDAVQFKFR